MGIVDAGVAGVTFEDVPARARVLGDLDQVLAARKPGTGSAWHFAGASDKAYISRDESRGPRSAALPKVNGNGTTHHRALRTVRFRTRSGAFGRPTPPESARLAVELFRLDGGALDVLLRASELAGDSPFRLPDSGCTRAVLEIHFTGCSSWPVSPGRRCTVSERRFVSGMAETGVDRETAESRVGSRRARHRGRVHEIGPPGAPVRSHAGMERLCRIVRGRMDQGGAQRRRRVHGTSTPNGRRSSFRDWAAEATDHLISTVVLHRRKSKAYSTL